MFDGWLYSSPSTTEKRSSVASISKESRKSVSEPMPLDRTLSSNRRDAAESGAGSDSASDFDSQFETMLVRLPS